MNKNLERQMKWIESNLETVRIIGNEYEYGNSIANIVKNHDNEFDRHKVYAALDYLGIPRRNRTNNWDAKYDNIISTVKNRGSSY